MSAGIVLGVIIRYFKAKTRTKRPDAETLARAVEAEVQKVRGILVGLLLQRPPLRYISV